MKKAGVLSASLAPLLLAACSPYTVAMAPLAGISYVLIRSGVISGSVDFEDVAVEKLDAGDPNQGSIRVSGSFRFVPAKIAGDRFADLEGVGFMVRLFDSGGEELTSFRWPLRLTTEGLTLAAVPANEFLPFVIERDISRNIWELVDSARIVEVYGL